MILTVIYWLTSVFVPPVHEDPFYVPPGHTDAVMCIMEPVEVPFYVNGYRFTEIVWICTGYGH